MIEPTDRVVPVDEQIACVIREIGMRKRVYPGWVAKGRMTQEEALAQVEAMTAVLATLRSCSPGHRRPDREPFVP